MASFLPYAQTLSTVRLSPHCFVVCQEQGGSQECFRLAQQRMKWMKWQCKGRARRVETFAEVFGTGLTLADPPSRPTQPFCFVHTITGTRFHWSREKRRGTFQKVLNSPRFVLFFPTEFSNMRRNFCKPERDVADSVKKKCFFFFLNL